MGSFRVFVHDGDGAADIKGTEQAAAFLKKLGDSAGLRVVVVRDGMRFGRPLKEIRVTGHVAHRDAGQSLATTTTRSQACRVSTLAALVLSTSSL